MCRQLHTNYLPYIEVIAVCKTNEKKITCILPVVSASPVLISKRLKVTQCPVLMTSPSVTRLIHLFHYCTPCETCRDSTEDQPITTRTRSHRTLSSTGLYPFDVCYPYQPNPSRSSRPRNHRSPPTHVTSAANPPSKQPRSITQSV